MSKPQTYVGIDNDLYGGMTSIGKMIRDAWVFGLLDEQETCAGWTLPRINALLQQVNAEWDKYGCLVSKLPPELFERHQRIHGEALRNAQAAGWSGELEVLDET